MLSATVDRIAVAQWGTPVAGMNGYAIGDVVRASMLALKRQREGAVLAELLAGSIRMR
jgi:pyruvate/2-oxoglutarate dehydrogenase complex dihydrolipoamide dehydrogenase (E3) component